MPTYQTGSKYSNLPKSTQDYLANGAAKGERNPSLLAAACQMRDAGHTRDQAEPVLLARALTDGLKEPEILKTIKSAYDRAPRKPATGHGASQNGISQGAAPSSPPHSSPPPPPRTPPAPRPLPTAIADGFATFLDAGFLPGEFVVLGKGYIDAAGELGVNGGTRNKIESWKSRFAKNQVYPDARDGVFARVNPMGGGGKTDADVAAFRHVLAEFDLDKNGNLIPKELQYAILLDSGLPIASIVNSGNKSVQALIVVNAPDHREYVRRVKIVIEYFSGYDGYDATTTNPSRYCRCPGVERNLYDATGKLTGTARQELLAVKVGAASWDEWEKGRSAKANVDFTDDELREIAKDRLERLTRKSCPFPSSMSTAAYHGIAGEIIRIIEPGIEPCPETILVQFLIGFGNLLGRAPFLKQAAIHHLNEFGVLVGETSLSRKGTAWYAVRNLLESVDPTWARSRVKGAFPSGESIIHEVRDAGSTGAGKRKVYDQGVGDKRLLMLEPEFARFLENCSRTGCTLSSVTREVWDSPEVLYTSGKIAPEQATGAHISLIGHVTQQDLLECLREVENKNGFSNRILWCAARRTKKIADPVWIEWNQTPETEVVNRLKLIVQTFKAAPTRRLTWSKPAGLNAWRCFYNDIRADTGGILGSIIARAMPHVARLTAIYTVLDHSTIMEPHHLQAAIAVWDYCERSAQWVFGQKTGNKKADQIYWALLREESGMTRTQIINDVFSGRGAKTILDMTLGVLADAKLAYMTVERSTGASKPTERWFAVHSK